ncbi:SpoIIE family protein phosphatase [Blastococcus haudaquaticus]|uniref:Serine/threonine-protein kinase RsbW n=1 Tax=Blastococcus haudaquaticus TaxID=1938745 RepID=A0A286H793_9ACTN|nr:SpoIIE family protein phosphatase [Blastococcus haudaquaticus]SOE03582.1 serine/threonine-protein kinase RsbW [Blastococcus haudaquaticus]
MSATDPVGNPGQDPRAQLGRLLEEDPADLYESAPMGYLSTLPDGRIVKVNRTFCAWTGRRADDLIGTRFQDLLSVGGRVFHETHLAPLLRMQGAVREIALDVVRVDGSLLPCLLNAVELRDESGAPLLVRATLFEATARRRYERELLAAQRAAEESEARSRVVQMVVSDLAAATTVHDVATVIVERSRAALGASGATLVLVDEGVAGDPDSVPALRAVHTEGLPPELLAALRDAANGQLALELAQGVRIVELDRRMRSVQPTVAAAMAGAGLSELVTVPVAADSRRLGVLILGLGDAPNGDLISLDEPGVVEPVGAADIELLSTLGRQAGQALERALLHEETARQAERAAFLLEAARLLAGAADVSETVERLAQLAVGTLADLCVIDLVTEQGLTRPAARHRDPQLQHLADEVRERHLTARRESHPSIRALREGQTQWVRMVRPEFLSSISSDERHAEVAQSLDLTSIVAVPLMAEGRRLGVVTICADRQRGSFTEADVEVAEQLALQVALVVAKAQRYELDVRTSHTLQANLLPPDPPPLPGLSTAVRYLPATYGAEVGGDFYDVVQLPDGQVALAVGDVVGHDITAAATMGQLNSVYRALLADRPTPSAVIDRLQASWSLLGMQRMATALFASLDAGTGQLRIASAGHPPPLLITAGHAEFLPVTPSRMLGAPPAPAPALEWAGVLPVGATLLLFTDGLVESRAADIDEGLAHLLAAAVDARTSDPDELCDRVLADLTGTHRADDIALLALTRVG